MVETKIFSLDLSTYTRMYRGEQSQSLKKNVLFFILVLVFVVGISIYGYIKVGTLDVFFSWVPLIMIYSVILVLMHWLFPVYLYKNKENRFSFTNREYRFHEEELEIATEEGVISRMPYEVFVKKNIGKDYFALWESALTAHMIPFDAFETKEDIEYVEKVIAKKCV